jgi:hypothetical protein
MTETCVYRGRIERECFTCDTVFSPIEKSLEEMSWRERGLFTRT